ncbi:Quinohemoprotein alcohol dehydrogenase ADH-IIG precursor [Planctomycetes bacterium Pan216]|uniref:Quinohemoprotein alcohol dehydrogenase ADH-IIG n=1 Tax=Kolteria novifilia TaxID=2527975 RepID=A0A518B723_9BACT|nr:Quinohemoprotein alcohol dehydrogenase ADH-IIG precursor [Planctomycetes bacterium Pan216]
MCRENRSISIEPLEERAVPDAGAFVNGLYLALQELPSPPSSSETAPLIAQVESGAMSREALASQVLYSDASARTYMAGRYEHLLGRLPSSSDELTPWVQSLLNREMDTEDVNVAILSSNEFLDGVDRDPERFVAKAYQKVLFREPGSGEVDGWANALASGEMTTEQVARGIHGAEESFAKRLSAAYEALLNRRIDPQTEGGWLAQLTAGNISYEGVIGAIVASDEADKTWEETAPIPIPRALLGEASVIEPGEWTQYLQSSNGDRAIEETTLGRESIDGLKIHWEFDTNAPVAATPIVVGGVVYAGDMGGEVHALSQSTGQAIWHATANGPVTASMLMTREGVLVLGDQAGFIYGLDGETGDRLWAIDTATEFGEFASAIWGSPIQAADYVVVPVSSNQSGNPGGELNHSGRLLRIDPRTGEFTVLLDTIAPELKALGSSGASIWSSPAYDSSTNTVFATSANNYTGPFETTDGDGNEIRAWSDAFIAVDLTTTEVRWRTQTTRNDAWVITDPFHPVDHPDFGYGDSPAVVTTTINGVPRKVVAAGEKSGIFYVLDAETGEILNPIEPLPTSPVNTEPGLLIEPAESADGSLFSDSSYDEQLDLYFANGLDVARTSVTDPIVHDGTQGYLVAIEGDGSAVRWRLDTEAQNYAGTTVANGLVYLQSQDGTLLVVDGATGSIVSQVALGIPSQSGPAIANGRVFVGAGDSLTWFFTGGELDLPGKIVALGL